MSIRAWQWKDFTGPNRVAPVEAAMEIRSWTTTRFRAIVIFLIRSGDVMNQIKFNCPHCKQSLECDEQYAGRLIPCPACQGQTLVPPIPGKSAAAPNNSGMTFVPEGWQKPGSGKTIPAPPKTGMTYVPDSWRSPPPHAGAE
jgi:DNA-directed RNA polymerase subunit RPC12/RpoP